MTSEVFYVSVGIQRAVSSGGLLETVTSTPPPTDARPDINQTQCRLTSVITEVK